MSILLTRTWSEPGTEVVPQTRHRVREVIASSAAAVEPSLVDDIELVVSELLANAVLYAKAPIELELQLATAALRLEVSDASPDLLPPPPPKAALAETGRGLMLTAKLSSRWGWQVDNERKTVWVEFDL